MVHRNQKRSGPARLLPAAGETQTSLPHPKPIRSRVAGTSIGSEVSVLGCFSRRQTLISWEIAERLNLSSETVDVIANKLVSLHCLEQVAPGAYTLAKDWQPPRARTARPIRSPNEDVYVTVVEIRCATWSANG